MERIEQNQAIVTKYLDEKEFQEDAFRELVKSIYEDIRKQAAGPWGGGQPG